MNRPSKWPELTEDVRNLVFRKLGPLAHLVGVWEGTGYTSIFRPDGQNNKPFFFQQNTTQETLTFIPLIMSVTDRGAIGQEDISLKGLIYEQLIVDEHDLANVLHFESGQWLFIPETTVPPHKKTVARQATILHGASFTAIGDAPEIVPVPGKPTITSVDATPVGPGASDPGYLDQFHNAPLLAGLPEGSIKDPSLLLTHRIATQMMVDVVTFDVSARLTTTASQDEICGISNIPFLDKNAQVTSLQTTFYVEHIEDGLGNSWMQLQYLQKIMLNFLNINWPHLSVATLRRVRL